MSLASSVLYATPPPRQRRTRLRTGVISVHAVDGPCPVRRGQILGAVVGQNISLSAEGESGGAENVISFQGFSL